MASMSTPRASLGSARFVFSSISRVRRVWASDRRFTPMRTVRGQTARLYASSARARQPRSLRPAPRPHSRALIFFAAASPVSFLKAQYHTKITRLKPDGNHGDMGTLSTYRPDVRLQGSDL